MDRPSPCIGLFGTCGDSKWRAPFTERFSALHFNFFNPQVEDWSEELAAVEATHLAQDEIIVFPVTDETDAIGSLTESGFSILQALKSAHGRDFVIMIHDHVDPAKVTDPALAKASNRARTLALAHLRELNMPNVYLVSTLEAALMLTDELYRLRKQQSELDARRVALSRFTQ